VTRPSGRRAPWGLAVAGAIGLSLLAAACGSSGAKVAQVGTGGGTNPRPQHQQTFSACMRSHGVPNFPDANTEGDIQAAGIDETSPAFRTAFHSCQGLLQGRRRRVHGQSTPEQQRQLLAFAKCMRSHGVPKFSDPIFHPDGRVEIGAPQDANSPSFIAAANACRSKLSTSDANKLFSKLSGK
jgi:hypothetical protein